MSHDGRFLVYRPPESSDSKKKVLQAVKPSVGSPKIEPHRYPKDCNIKCGGVLIYRRYRNVCLSGKVGKIHFLDFLIEVELNKQTYLRYQQRSECDQSQTNKHRKA